MTPEKRFTKIEENLLVTAEMLRPSERRREERFAQHDQQIAAMLRIVENHQTRMQEIKESRLSLESAMRVLLEQMDRFIRGLKSNGRQ